MSDHDLLAPLLLTNRQASFEDDCACPESPGLLVASPPTVLENDCACPMPHQGTSAALSGVLYHQADQVFVDDRLPQGFRLLLTPYAPQGPSVANRAAWERWQAFAQPQPLSEPIDFQLAEQALLLPLDAPAPLPHSQPETLTVWLHVTNACNLDCPYCYVRKSSARMSEDVGLWAVERVFQSAQQRGFRRIKLKYAGGEATLHFRLIRRLAAHAQALAQQTGLALDQVILSNGTLLRPEEVAWMLENRVRLMISLDGLGEVHDQMRPARDGKSSFARLSQTIEELLLPAGLIPNITLTVTRLNSAHIAETVRWALTRNLPLNLNFYRQPVGSPEDLAAEEQALIEGIRAAYRVYEELLPETPFLNGILDRVKFGGHLQACGVGSSYLVITHEGKVAQCQMLLDRAGFPSQEGDLLAGIQHGPIPLMTVEGKAVCATCRYRYFCAGGCPLETYRRSGRWNAPHPNCRVYQELLPEALRLEGLRLLKVHGHLH